MDGATLGEEILYVLTPMALPGIVTVPLNIIFGLNEALDDQFNGSKCCSLNCFHRELFQPRGLVSCKVKRRIDHGDCAYFGDGLVQSKTTCPGPYLWCGEIRKTLWDAYSSIRYKRNLAM